MYVNDDCVFDGTEPTDEPIKIEKTIYDASLSEHVLTITVRIHY